ncbi:hypothetical protein [Raoultella planticola]|uniref:hypothetical protein n=1 Tax=Raoultella planticola TaxID=575 RepID=UPI001F39D60B|nr:hypothetical protein [Raoultella planticola]ELY5218333.1 hypothetical protein [Yersinia enterocolitica]MCE9858524.1 hypothetical protein [Raoultella planticola]
MYQETIDALKATQTIASHIKKLGVISSKTEDPLLQRHIANTITRLQQSHGNPKVKGKSTPGNLYNLQEPTIKTLITYCEQYTVTKKPEWQVLAERHGWTPPAQ